MRGTRQGRCRAAGMLLGVLLAAGCASGEGGDGGGDSTRAEPSAPTTPAPTTPAAARPLVHVTVTGGIAGVRNDLLVRDDGTYTTSTKTGPKGSGRMTPAELAELRRALEKADFARLPDEATGSPVADGFTYRITYAGHTVTTDERTRLPALRDVFAALPDD
ncbi:protealysin inhibitor emfourin [Streptomyces sp. NPDC002402]